MAHVTSICFENIHPFLKLPMSVALDDIFNKLVLKKIFNLHPEPRLIGLLQETIFNPKAPTSSEISRGPAPDTFTAPF